jgi:hypothetical protein
MAANRISATYPSSIGGVFSGVDRDRFVVGDETWPKLSALLPGKASDRSGSVSRYSVSVPITGSPAG